MERKGEIIRAMSLDKAPEYFEPRDRQVIMGWANDEAKAVLDSLTNCLDSGSEGLTSFICPFCIHNYAHLNAVSCNGCEYAKHHGCCLDPISDYEATLEYVFESSVSKTEQVFTNEILKRFLIDN
jgi:hypothetical protein